MFTENEETTTEPPVTEPPPAGDPSKYIHVENIGKGKRIL